MASIPTSSARNALWQSICPAGQLEGEPLAAHLAAADVFAFPSRTDTFGVVQLEALACVVPVAAYPVPGPQDVIAGNQSEFSTRISNWPASRL